MYRTQQRPNVQRLSRLTRNVSRNLIKMTKNFKSELSLQSAFQKRENACFCFCLWVWVREWSKSRSVGWVFLFSVHLLSWSIKFWMGTNSISFTSLNSSKQWQMIFKFSILHHKRHTQSRYFTQTNNRTKVRFLKCHCFIHTNEVIQMLKALINMFLRLRFCDLVEMFSINVCVSTQFELLSYSWKIVIFDLHFDIFISWLCVMLQ